MVGEKKCPLQITAIGVLPRVEYSKEEKLKLKIVSGWLDDVFFHFLQSKPCDYSTVTAYKNVSDIYAS